MRCEERIVQSVYHTPANKGLEDLSKPVADSDCDCVGHGSIKVLLTRCNFDPCRTHSFSTRSAHRLKTSQSGDSLYLAQAFKNGVSHDSRQNGLRKERIPLDQGLKTTRRQVPTPETLMPGERGQ